LIGVTGHRRLPRKKGAVRFDIRGQGDGRKTIGRFARSKRVVFPHAEAGRSGRTGHRTPHRGTGPLPTRGHDALRQLIVTGVFFFFSIGRRMRLNGRPSPLGRPARERSSYNLETSPARSFPGRPTIAKFLGPSATCRSPATKVHRHPLHLEGPQVASLALVHLSFFFLGGPGAVPVRKRGHDRRARAGSPCPPPTLRSRLRGPAEGDPNTSRRHPRGARRGITGPPGRELNLKPNPVSRTRILKLPANIDLVEVKGSFITCAPARRTHRFPTVTRAGRQFDQGRS